MSELPAGTPVRARGERWLVAARAAHADCDAYTLVGTSPLNAAQRRTLLAPFDRLIPLTGVVAPRFARPRRWAAEMRHRLAHALPFGALTAAAGARLEVLAYQLEPALAMLRHGCLRILIADEVGLGKTIQAALVINELMAASDTARVIVVTPAGLREQWTHELADRFGLKATGADAAWLVASGRALPPEVNPWSLPGLYLASLDFVKRPEVLRALEDVTWDLFVLDEAHGCGIGTSRLNAAQSLGARARRILLLTATPPDGDPDQRTALDRIGAHDAEPIVEFRRTRADVALAQGPAAAGRRSRLHDVRITVAEHRMHRLLGRYARQVWREAAGRSDARARLAVTVLRKRALSSAWSLERSVRRRLALLADGQPETDRQLPLPFTDEDPLADDVPDAVLGTPGMSDAGHERSLLEDIARAAAEAAGAESKLRYLVRFLGRVREPAIIFTEYRDTLERLEDVLVRAGHRPLLLHGGMTPRERVAVQHAFNREDALLLATDAASEGLNLQARCRTVVHFEVPWTPARLEQRAGRVDRFGQPRRVHEALLVARDTAERFVLAPLVERARRAREHGGDARAMLGALTESRVAAALMERRAIDLGPPPPRRPHAPRLREDGEREAQRLAAANRTKAMIPDGAPLPALVICRAARRVRGFILLVAWRLEDRYGRTVHESIVPLQVRFAMSLRRPRAADVRALIDDVRRRGWRDVARAAARYLVADLAAARRLHAAMFLALERREMAIRRAQPSAARSLVQLGLFDHRAERTLAGRRAAAGLLADETGDRDRVLAAAGQLTGRIALVGLRLEP